MCRSPNSPTNCGAADGTRSVPATFVGNVLITFSQRFWRSLTHRPTSSPRRSRERHRHRSAAVRRASPTWQRSQLSVAVDCRRRRCLGLRLPSFPPILAASRSRLSMTAARSVKSLPTSSASSREALGFADSLRDRFELGLRVSLAGSLHRPTNRQRSRPEDRAR